MGGGEFKLIREEGGYYVYDFVCLETKKIIEYHGDIFHGNPIFFKENDYPNPFKKTLLAKTIWEKDADKLKIADQNGFEVLVIWDSELRGQNKIEDVVEKCIKFLTN